MNYFIRGFCHCFVCIPDANGFNSFKELAGSRPLSELRTAEEAAAAASASSENGEQANGEEAQPDGAEPSPAILTEAEELEKFIAIREETYKKAKEFDSKIINFETAIRRPYFHVRPLNAAELENWNNYLDFIEKEGDFNKVIFFFKLYLLVNFSFPACNMLTHGGIICFIG